MSHKCNYYVSIEQTECGEIGMPVTVKWPGGSSQNLILCDEHLRVVSTAQRAASARQAARRRVSGKEQKRARQAGAS